MLALEAAIEEFGVDGVEFDVHLSSDNVLLLQHDETLDRMTNGSGLIAQKPWHGCLDQLRTKHDSFPGEPITTFAAALSALISKTTTSKNRFTVIIDVKDDQNISVLDALSRELKKLPAEHNLEIFVGCWCDEFMIHAKQLSMPAGTRFTWIGEVLTSERATNSLYDSFDVNIDELVAAPLQEALNLKKDVFVWTCNTDEQIAKAKQLQVTGILTDDPKLV